MLESELRQLQNLPLEIKIKKTTQRIIEWYEQNNGEVYISFSGGKDSTVLLDIVRNIYPQVPAVFCDTGLEFPEIKEFVKTFDNVEIIKPKMNFKDVLNKYGYPVISKEQAGAIYKLRHQNLSQKTINKYLHDKKRVVAKKHQYLLNAPFEISDKCCDVMKKNPFKTFEKKTGLKMITGEMAIDSRLRLQQYLKTGCNSFDTKRPKSKPLGFWTDKDIWAYIYLYNLKYCSVYDNGNLRTGCVFCMFGAHREVSPNRFEILKNSHPNLYDYCINKLNLKEVFDFVNIKY